MSAVKVTIKDVKPIPPPKRVAIELDLSVEEAQTLRNHIAVWTGAPNFVHVLYRELFERLERIS